MYCQLMFYRSKGCKVSYLTSLYERVKRLNDAEFSNPSLRCLSSSQLLPFVWVVVVVICDNNL